MVAYRPGTPGYTGLAGVPGQPYYLTRYARLLPGMSTSFLCDLEVHASSLSNHRAAVIRWRYSRTTCRWKLEWSRSGTCCRERSLRRD